LDDVLREVWAAGDFTTEDTENHRGHGEFWEVDVRWQRRQDAMVEILQRSLSDRFRMTRWRKVGIEEGSVATIGMKEDAAVKLPAPSR
jgi:alpha-L-fucosidase